MFLLQTVTPDDAEGPVAQAYSLFPIQIGVPAPLRQAGLISYFMGHPRLSPGLLACIRYAVAVRSGHSACEALNRGILKAMGVEDGEIAALPASPASAPLEESEEAMLGFVLRAFDDPDSVTARDIQALRDAGYQDSDVLDALHHAASMLAGSVLYKTFARA